MRWTACCLALGAAACAGAAPDPVLDPAAPVPPVAYRSILESHPPLPISLQTTDGYHGPQATFVEGPVLAQSGHSPRGRRPKSAPTCHMPHRCYSIVSLALRGQNSARPDLCEEPAAQLAGKLLAGNCG